MAGLYAHRALSITDKPVTVRPAGGGDMEAITAGKPGRYRSVEAT
jgi:hypothetical protein